ncbi:hypothetical protein, partial [Sphaerisporangium flaviroseum]|uniref:hypothetical protein n=1 Tax=Sphaerisporangium flaviroseum TaxID=509199 RepID=UPI0031ED1AD3
MSIAADALLTERRAAGEPVSRDLEIGHLRREVEMYERMLAEDLAHADEVRDPPTGARQRLAELEGDELAVRRKARINPLRDSRGPWPYARPRGARPVSAVFPPHPDRAVSRSGSHPAVSRAVLETAGLKLTGSRLIIA